MKIKSNKAVLEELYEDKKSKTFVSHLIKSYFPLTKVKMVEGNNTKVLICSLSGERMMPFDNLTEKPVSREVLTESLADRIKDGDKPEVFTKKEAGKVIAFTGQDTTTNLSYESILLLNRWVLEKVTSGDKTVNWLLSQSNSTKKKVENKFTYRKPSTLLGELDSLKRLKEIFEKEGY